MKLIDNYLAADLEVEGIIHSDLSLRIDGHFIGKIEGATEVSLGNTAQVSGSISAPLILINGRMEGDLITKHLSILKEGHVSGDLHTPEGGISVEQGGILEGNFC